LPPRVSLRVAYARGRCLLALGDAEQAMRALHPALELAAAQAFVVWDAVLRGALGEAVARLGDVALAEQLTAQALTALRDCGHRPALALACLSRVRALESAADPRSVFEPVSGWIDRDPVRPFRLACRMAEASWFRQEGNHRAARESALAAEAVLLELERLQEPADREALRVHPWRAILRQWGALPTEQVAVGNAGDSRP
jgi:tetratricopeptide (TPR) repeat protein